MNYGLIKAKKNKSLGKKTIEVIGLDTQYYTKARWNLFRILRADYETLLMSREQNNESMLDNYKDKFQLHMSAKNQFAAFARSFARHYKLDINFNIKIPEGAAT